MPGIDDKLMTAAEIKAVTDTKVNVGDIIGIEHGGTNATTKSAARTNLSVYSKSEVDSAINAVANSTRIAENSDLNDFKTTGVYNGNANSNISNTPVKNVFTLYVNMYSNNYVSQLYLSAHSSYTGVIYHRWYANGTWTSWYKHEGTAMT